jgi:hypothetical protein
MLVVPQEQLEHENVGLLTQVGRLAQLYGMLAGIEVEQGDPEDQQAR